MTIGRALTGTVVNLLVPGLGTLILGKWLQGLAQLGLLAAAWVVGFIGNIWPIRVLSFGLLGLLARGVRDVDWVWALVLGVLAIVGAGRTRRHQLP
ncbi:conserved membrane protein of unknown function [Candidatus Hydrogenisulfobacillus filiaventi]|uniref:Uncharacterized protein n=1 Tax=Candidatus Hydrogenisulfobacillus filiaventi TaxID=2707344 RepID=A0A6F8ZD01_9FIRM|nr:conserved membrane protein of unknown function [Candidatus Hydrogenisulfobacillus filiaventi]